MTKREDQAEIRITLEFTEIFTLDELYPDGDYPHFVTREDVQELVKKVGVHDVTNEWGFGDPQVSVQFKGFDLVTGRKTKYSDRLWTGAKDD